MKDIMFYKKELIMKCREQENIYIYGAGRNASDIYFFLQKNEIKISGFLVTDMAGNPETLFGLAVSTARALPENADHLVLVPVTGTTSRAYKEIFNHLVEQHVRNVYFFPKDILEDIKENVTIQMVRDIFNSGRYHFGENIPVEIKHSILVMEDADGQEYHWRFRNYAVKEQEIGSIADVFRDKSALQEFEEQYGRYHIFRTMEREAGGSGGTCAVYMARSHADKVEVQSALPTWPVPIQVGAALTEHDICKLKDNTGENISERNGNYSECSAIYWMWKNAPRTDYIGLCHYRRHFDIEEGELGRLGDCGVDVLATSPTFVKETAGEFLSTLIPRADIMALREAIDKDYPEYTPSAERFLGSRFYPPCNLFIMKYDLFLEYAEFVFTVTFEVERFYRERGFYRKDRYIGYLVECLLGIFLMKNKERLKIAYTDMRFYS